MAMPIGLKMTYMTSVRRTQMTPAMSAPLEVLRSNSVLASNLTGSLSGETMVMMSMTARQRPKQTAMTLRKLLKNG